MYYTYIPNLGFTNDYVQSTPFLLPRCFRILTFLLYGTEYTPFAYMAYNSYITFPLLPPPTRHVGSVPRDYCQVKATEDSRKRELFSSRHKEKET